LKELGSCHEGIRKKKGSLEETLSYSIYNDKSELYTISYRDKDRNKQASLKQFMQSEDYSMIPLTRITLISKDGNIVWRKGQKEILVKTKSKIGH
jgi:uncharacterized protein (UPF0248 family)